MKKVKTIPFEFVLEQLFALDPTVRPMFGCHAIYVGNKIVMSLRLKDEQPHDNGVWLATSREHHESLRNLLPSLRTIKLFGTTESGWQNLPYDGPSFEEEVTKACTMVLRGDPRIGQTPKPKVKKKRVSAENDNQTKPSTTATPPKAAKPTANKKSRAVKKVNIVKPTTKKRIASGKKTVRRG